jgi:hypothetical protein
MKTVRKKGSSGKSVGRFRAIGFFKADNKEGEYFA